jgi:hypothetical protein
VSQCAGFYKRRNAWSLLADEGLSQADDVDDRGAFHGQKK